MRVLPIERWLLAIVLVVLVGLVGAAAACGGTQRQPPLPEPDALAQQLPRDEALARRLGLGPRAGKPESATVLHRADGLVLLEARTAGGGLYLVLLDRDPTADEGGWDVAGAVLAAASGVERVHVVQATAADAVDVAVEGTAVGLWHLSADPPRPGLRQILATEGPAELVVEQGAGYPRSVRVGEQRFVGGEQGYMPAAQQ